MALPKLFQRIFWHNNTTPAINEDNLNAMSKAIDDIDDRVIELGDDVIEVVPIIVEGLQDLNEAVETAQTAATTATTKAGEASTSATTASTKAGEASTSATTASNKADAAAASATTASNKALVAEGYAVGEQNGTSVTSGSPYYHNNAEYYAGEASGSATAAAASATEAESWSAHPPYIGANGDWYVWDIQTSAYIDSGIDASITVDIADVTALAPDANPYVTNTGTDTDPVFHLFIPRGATGTDGVSPIVTITTITGGHRVTIVDEDHPTGQSFDVMDGSGSGDMRAAVYDPNGTVASAGGIEDYVAAHGGDVDLPFVTPEDYGAKGDGSTDDTAAFTAAFAASKNVICDGTKTYYFAGIVDASDLTDGDFNINNATLLNFHIKVGIKNVYEPKANYPYLSFKIRNGNIGTYSAIPANWQTPAIQTGNAIDLDNIVFKNTPYIVALTNSYRDYNKFRNLTFSYDSALWANVASWDLDAISLIASDGSFVKINTGSVNTGIPSTTGKFSGDGWIIENVCQFLSGKYTSYGFCHFYNNHTLNINRCVQTKFYFGTGTRVEISNSHFESLVSMPAIETLSDATGTVGTTSNIQVDFDNCYFTDRYTLECDKNYVTYTNCYFRVAGDATDKTIPLATVFGNYDYYNMECSIVDSLVYRMPMNTNKWKGYKEQVKLTRNFRNNTSNESTMAASIQATKSIGSGDYKYPQTGTYNYVGFTFTNSAEIAHERYEWTRTVSSLSSAGDGSSTMVGLVGGWGFEIYRTLPDSTIQRARFYDSPIEENYKTVTNKQFAFRERGNYIIIHKWTIFSPSSDYIEEDFYVPWCTVSAIPSYTVNNQVYEKNGVLVTLDNSVIPNLTDQAYAQVNKDFSIPSWSALTGKPFSSIGNGLTVTSDTLAADVQSVTVDSTGTASSSAVSYQRVGVNGSYTEINGTKYMEQTQTVSTSNDTTYTFTNAAITANSVIDVYADVFGINPSNVVVSSGSCVVTIPKQSSAISLGIRIYIK